MRAPWILKKVDSRGDQVMPIEALGTIASAMMAIV